MTSHREEPLTPLQRETLTTMYISDHQTERRPATDLTTSVDGLAVALGGHRPPLVYTAFDGDHFALTPQMRTYALHRGALPVNPENVVGYYDSVRHHGVRKDLVLADDLAVLNRCDELWIFTDAEPTPTGAARALVEGVLVELLFFLFIQERCGRTPTVRFIPIDTLFCATKDPVPYRGTYAETLAALTPDQAGVRKVAENAQLPIVVFIAHDPLDTKYVHWLRPMAYREGLVPVVPTLAIERSDLELATPENPIAATMAVRLSLCRLAGRLWIIPPIEHRPESYTVQLIRRMWSGPAHAFDDKVWSRLEVPKATSVDWHISQKETATRHG